VLTKRVIGGGSASYSDSEQAWDTSTEMENEAAAMGFEREGIGGGLDNTFGSPFACFASTKVQILTRRKCSVRGKKAKLKPPSLTLHKTFHAGGAGGSRGSEHRSLHGFVDCEKQTVSPDRNAGSEATPHVSDLFLPAPNNTPMSSEDIRQVSSSY
jgi:hypothetical protein